MNEKLKLKDIIMCNVFRKLNEVYELIVLEIWVFE